VRFVTTQPEALMATATVPRADVVICTYTLAGGSCSHRRSSQLAGLVLGRKSWNA
jgi:hypothetical protein